MARPKLRKFFKWTAALLGLCLCLLAVFVVNLVWFKPFSLNLFYERVMIELAFDDPELLTSLRILEQFGYQGHNDDLTPASEAFARERIERARRSLATLRRYDRAKQSPDQILSTDILAWFLDDIVRGEEFLHHGYPVNQMFGVQSSLPTFMATMHQVNTRKDGQNYLARLEKFPWKFGQVLEGLRTREDKGIVPPRFVIHRVLDEMRGFAAQAPTDNILYTSLEKKLSEAADLGEEDKKVLLEGAEARIRDAVYPAYRELIAYFEALEPKSTDDDGVWKLPDGAAYYAHRLRSSTTTDMTPEEVHALGLAEVERITREMRVLLKDAGHSAKSPAEWMAQLAQEERFLYPNTDEGRAQCLADYQAIIDEADGKLGEIFDLRPTSPVHVERIPPFKEKTSAGAYYNRPAMDGSRPGIFYANMRDMNEVPTFGMRTLVYHEAIPGHHFQIGVQQELEGVPMLRRVLPFTAFTEGWALYAERLAGEHGFHDSPYSRLGGLQAELFRAVRLVVDTGIHHKRWTREEAIDYMAQTTGMPRGDVVSEIERYIVMPGQACAYKMGQLKILEMRQKAMDQLGDRFDLKEFHNAVLQNGSLPLEILETVVDRYIAAAR